MTFPRNLIAWLLMKGMIGWPLIFRAGSKEVPDEALMARLWHFAGVVRMHVHCSHFSMCLMNS